MNDPAEEQNPGSITPISTISVHKPAPAFSSSYAFGSEEHGGSPGKTSSNPSLLTFDASSRTTVRPLPHRTASSQERSRSPSSTTPLHSGDQNSETRRLIIQSFAPLVSLYASLDCQELINAKGLGSGLASLLKPFAEKVNGKVIIRDSQGVSRAWDDFGLRIKDHKENERFIKNKVSDVEIDSNRTEQQQGNEVVGDFDTLLGLLLDKERADDNAPTKLTLLDDQSLLGRGEPSSLFSDHLRLLLSHDSLVPYETFCHPVACLVAVSSRNEAPIETLRQLYALTGRDNQDNPTWMGIEYLRYYVLIHDEDRDDIAKSTALFDLMKKHFGLHCHLLRLRSLQCVATDDDSFQLRQCSWLSPTEKESRLQGEDLLETDGHGGEPFIFESDASAIAVLIREMVTQSIVPFMENRSMSWNDQIASRRKGIGGRFMSISKRWTGFGSSKPQSSAAGPNNSNFNTQAGVYPSDAPEALMRSLGDYAMMLRDWKLASITYDLARSDFSHDKAWSYHAAANEMFAIATLLVSTSPSRFRPEQIDQALDAAIYSYLTRTTHPHEAKRCLIITAELLFQRGRSSIDHAVGWASRLLQLSILGPLEQAMLTERIAVYHGMCFSGLADQLVNRRRRSAAFWGLLAAMCWTRSKRSTQARRRMHMTHKAYSEFQGEGMYFPFNSMQDLWNSLCDKIDVSDSLLVHQISEDTALQHRRTRSSVNPKQSGILDAFVADSGTEVSAFDNRPVARASHGDLQSASDLVSQSDGFE